jgi:RNA polymerase subunit RPABC4/transcription elongation factor Spt4
MEKKYCIHCRSLHTKETVCNICGKSEFQEIKIVIQHQTQSNSNQLFVDNYLSSNLELT